MNILQEWAREWGVPPEALAALKYKLGVAASSPGTAPTSSPTSEAYVQSLVRLEAPTHDVWLTRNNVGALVDKSGRPVRFGLSNESKAQNEVLKSGDLIGIRKRLIEPRHVGTILGQFVSRECKHVGWRYTGGEHEDAQLNWAGTPLLPPGKERSDGSGGT